MAQTRSARPGEGDPGPSSGFAVAMRHALAPGDWSLGALAAELTHLGHPVTGATLSYWQQGRRRPGRRRSAGIVRAMEDVLGVESGSLLGHVGGPRARGKGARYRQLAEGRDNYADRVEEMFAELEVGSSPAHSVVLVHETVRIDADGSRRSEQLHQIVRSEQDGVRSIVMGQIDVSGADGPGLVEGLTVGRPGAAVVDPAMRILLVRIDLPQELPLGEFLVFEATTHYPWASHRTHGHDRWVTRAMREHVIDVDFHPDLVPAQVEAFLTAEALRNDVGPNSHVVDVHGTSAQAVHLDVPPGTSGVRWLFPGEDPASVGFDTEEPPVAGEAVLAAWDAFDVAELLDH